MQFAYFLDLLKQSLKMFASFQIAVTVIKCIISQTRRQTPVWEGKLKAFPLLLLDRSIVLTPAIYDSKQGSRGVARKPLVIFFDI